MMRLVWVLVGATIGLVLGSGQIPEAISMIRARVSKHLDDASLSSTVDDVKDNLDGVAAAALSGAADVRAKAAEFVSPNDESGHDHNSSENDDDDQRT